MRPTGQALHPPRTGYNSEVRPHYPEDGASGLTKDEFRIEFFAKTDAPDNEVDLEIWEDGEPIGTKILGATPKSGKTFYVQSQYFKDNWYHPDVLYEWQITIWAKDESGNKVCIYRSDKWSFDTKSCTEGATKCEGYDLYKCQDGKWQLVEENSEQCGYTPRRDLRWLALLAPALLAALPELTQEGGQL